MSSAFGLEKAATQSGLSALLEKREESMDSDGNITPRSRTVFC
jgi:hypothetical protein